MGFLQKRLRKTSMKKSIFYITNINTFFSFYFLPELKDILTFSFLLGGSPSSPGSINIKTFLLLH